VGFRFEVNLELHGTWPIACLIVLVQPYAQFMTRQISGNVLQTGFQTLKAFQMCNKVRSVFLLF